MKIKKQMVMDAITTTVIVSGNNYTTYLINTIMHKTKTTTNDKTEQTNSREWL